MSIQFNVPIGATLPYFGDTAPNTYLICNGQMVSKQVFPELFEIIGYKFGGSGDNFKIPDLKECGVIGHSNTENSVSPILGETIGENSHIQTEAEMAIHSHKQKGWAIEVQPLANSGIFAMAQSDIYDNYDSNTHQAGGGQAMSLISQSVVVNFIIKAESETQGTSIFNDTVDNIENKNNRCTLIDENSTNDSYPTAKAVYDLFNSK